MRSDAFAAVNVLCILCLVFSSSTLYIAQVALPGFEEGADVGLGFEVDVAVAVLVLVFVVVVVVFPPPELWRSMTSLLWMTCRGCDFVGVVIAVAFSNATLLRTMGEA